MTETKCIAHYASIHIALLSTHARVYICGACVYTQRIRIDARTRAQNRTCLWIAFNGEGVMDD